MDDRKSDVWVHFDAIKVDGVARLDVRILTTMGVHGHLWASKRPVN